MASDDILQLQQPLKDGGIRSVNFFNGRLLSGRDLSREQEARRESGRRLGLALGEGVAFGLEARRDTERDTAAAPVLRVRAGLALNRAGQALQLAQDTSVALTRKFTAVPGEEGCLFARCDPVADGVYVAGAGIYVLALAPARAGEGRAPSNGLDPASVRCNTDALVESVQLRLLALNPLRFTDLGPGTPQFRNRLAYRCFGIDAREAALADPWRADAAGHGLMDELRAGGGGLTDQDVPLALLYWTAQGLQFVDNWAVRRVLQPPEALTGPAFQAQPRRAAEAVAMCEQFREHLADLLAAAPVPDALVATQHFRFLPPFGVVPLQQPPLRGVAEAVFFAGVVRRPAPGTTQLTPFIDARLLGALREHALAAAPTDLAQREFIRLYRPWQNARALAEGRSAQAVRVFASGLVPELALARADLAHFDYANYANCCGGS